MTRPSVPRPLSGGLSVNPIQFGGTLMFGPVKASGLRTINTQKGEKSIAWASVLCGEAGFVMLEEWQRDNGPAPLAPPQPGSLAFFSFSGNRGREYQGTTPYRGAFIDGPSFAELLNPLRTGAIEAEPSAEWNLAPVAGNGNGKN